MTVVENNKGHRFFEQHKVKIDSLVPAQQTRSSTKILRSADVYQQRFLKFKSVGIFHSYAEYIYAALIEANPDVDAFIPQPYSFRVGKRRYIPDCYYQKQGQKYVVEIKPGGTFSEEIRAPLTTYLDFHNIRFDVISNEEILERETLGLNWIQIIQTLLSAEHDDTENEEYRIWQQVAIGSKLTVGDIVDIGDRIHNRRKEIALYRLAHLGKVCLDLDQQPIGFDTEVSLCD